jgi:predicted metal-dependent HD superfamily phosphohydrolase
VYQPLAKDNEERSFAMAKEFMLECEATESVIEFVRDMILATKKHRAKDDMDAAIMIGLDLNIFAREPKRYAEYEKQIREEYAAVPLAEYCSKRAAILEEFLAQPVIYESETIREVYEEPARFNLETAIARLKNGIA